MKAPKHITTLARDILNSDPFYAKHGEGDRWLSSIEKELMDIRTALLKGRYYTRVDTVSKSGMSRVIVIKYIKDNKLYGVCDYIYRLAGCDKKHRITGCGMDMLFAAQYDLFTKLCPNHDYGKSMPRYRSL